jgi:acyl dehydratase
MPDPEFYAEDFTVGRRFELGTHTPTAAEMTAFAVEWDPLPVHISEESATATHFGGQIASGLHTLAIANRLMLPVLTSRAAVIAGRGFRSVQLLKPVRPGVPLSGHVEVLEQTLRDDGRGVVVWHEALTDDTGETVLTVDVDCLMWRRPAAAAG